MTTNVIKAHWAAPLKLSARRRQAPHDARRWDIGRGRWKDKRRDEFVAERLRILRIVLGYSDIRMADEIGVSLQTYRKWEAGGKIRKWMPLQEFLVRREISMDWFISGNASNVRSDIGSGNVVILPVGTPYSRQLAGRSLADSVRDVFKMLPPEKQTAVVNFLRGVWQAPVGPGAA